MEKKGGKSGIKILIIGIILAVLVFGYYFYLTNRRNKEISESKVEVTAVQNVLLRNLDKNYPPTPKEVLKVYGEIAMCIHGQSYTDEEFEQLASQIQKIYDEELIAEAGNNGHQYLESLKSDIEDLKKQGIVISSYTLPSAADVSYYTMDGYDWAKLYFTFNLRKGTNRTTSEELFLLRKDGEGRWKIYGWIAAPADDAQSQTGDS
ncbi:MAG: hypothetical protein K2O16_01160 [Lachnospiraceae bacterium]|nr:hypothetical protein [Lachnospiraceae bacterium]MDE7330838.1 hypothetical protein [Lachnospiraceae bacterium]